MEIFIALTIGIVASYLASYIFLKHFINGKRPIIDICEDIAYSRHPRRNQNFHFFKFVNKTNEDIFDVSCELTFMTAYNTGNGQSYIAEDIKLADSFFSHINKKDPKDNMGLHAYRIYPEDNLEDIWDSKPEHSFIRLKIMAKHSLTGLSKVFYKDFYIKKSIVEGDFNLGDDCTIRKS